MSKSIKNEEHVRVPRLRFHEFRDAGEWLPGNLGDLFENRQESGFKTLPLLSLTDREGIIPQEDSNRKNSASVDKTRYLRVVPGDIAYNTMRMWEGRSAYVDREGIISPAYTVCKPVGAVNGLFHSYYFKTYQLIEQFRRYSQGLVKDTLNLKYAAFSQIPILTPKPEEQQKIADCLSSLDAQIAVQAEKIDVLKTHKKGLMQHLFPLEGETVPRLRFPEFRVAGEWKATCLGELGTFTGGGTPSKTKTEYWQGHIPWISSSDVSDESIRDVNITRFITKEALTKSATKLIAGGSILLVSRVGVGKLAIIESPVCTSQDFTNFTPSKDNPIFLGYYLKSSAKTLENLCQGMGIKGFTKEDISKLMLCLPKFNEQQKIADCLLSLDALIAAQAEKHDALKTHKKGLMQQLFPAMDYGG